MRMTRPDGAPSWSASTSDPLGLAILLYIRDTLQIAHVASPRLPPVTPTVPVVDSSALDPTRLAEQWNQRWTEATGPGGNVGIGLESPRSPFFDNTPELRKAFELFLEPAARWVAPARRAGVERFRAHRAAGRRDPIFELITDWQQTAGREPAPFSLTIRLVPVEGAGTWTIGPLEYLVAEGLASDLKAYTEWLRPVIARAAAREQGK